MSSVAEQTALQVDVGRRSVRQEWGVRDAWRAGVVEPAADRGHAEAIAAGLPGMSTEHLLVVTRTVVSYTTAWAESSGEGESRG